MRAAEDAQAWLGTDLALPEFVRLVRSVAGEEQYELLLRWASRRGPKLSEATFAEMERLAELVRELLVRWEVVEVPEAWRHARGRDCR